MDEKPITGWSPSSNRDDYTDEELEFLKAMDALRQRRPFPTCCEVLEVVKQLGYRKVGN